MATEVDWAAAVIVRTRKIASRIIAHAPYYRYSNNLYVSIKQPYFRAATVKEAVPKRSSIDKHMRTGDQPTAPARAASHPRTNSAPHESAPDHPRSASVPPAPRQ